MFVAAALHDVVGDMDNITGGMTVAAQSQQQALDALPATATPREQLHTLIRHHFGILLGPRSSFIPVMLYEWRSLTPAQRKGIARIKDSYEATWMPVLEALAQQGALQAEPGVARLFIFGALNWAVQWFSPQKGQSLDALEEVMRAGNGAALQELLRLPSNGRRGWQMGRQSRWSCNKPDRQTVIGGQVRHPWPRHPPAHPAPPSSAPRPPPARR